MHKQRPSVNERSCTPQRKAGKAKDRVVAGRPTHHRDEEVDDLLQAGPMVPDPILVDVSLSDVKRRREGDLEVRVYRVRLRS